MWLSTTTVMLWLYFVYYTMIEPARAQRNLSPMLYLRTSEGINVIQCVQCRSDPSVVPGHGRDVWQAWSLVSVSTLCSVQPQRVNTRVDRYPFARGEWIEYDMNHPN